MIYAFGLLLWLCASLLTMGVLCFLSAVVFWVLPNQATHKIMWFWYEHWVCMLGWWVRKLIPNIQLDIDKPSKNTPYIMIANHYSWLDILVLYATVFGHDRAFVFVMKRSLIKIPMIGIVCWGLGHPLLYRGKSRRKNLVILKQATEKAVDYQHGIMIFPEGTRYTKVSNPPTSLQHLLKPRTVGFEYIAKTISEKVEVIDVTLVYGSSQHGIMDFLLGKTGRVKVIAKRHIVSAKDAEEWLLDTWSKKDQVIQEVRSVWADDGSQS